MFKVYAPSVDVEKIIAEVKRRVDEKKQKGVYSTAILPRRIQHTSILQVQDDDEFIKYYLECLKDSVYVDIRDFEIIEKRRRFVWLFVGIKKLIWKILKFYTYRLWSQQNQVNGLMLSALEHIETRYNEKVSALEQRIVQLENAIGKNSSEKKSASS
jgi:hypothetical protein